MMNYAHGRNEIYMDQKKCRARRGISNLFRGILWRRAADKCALNARSRSKIYTYINTCWAGRNVSFNVRVRDAYCSDTPYDRYAVYI